MYNFEKLLSYTSEAWCVSYLWLHNKLPLTYCFKTTALFHRICGSGFCVWLSHLGTLFQDESETAIKVGCSHQEAQLRKDLFPSLLQWLLAWFHSLWVVGLRAVGTFCKWNHMLAEVVLAHGSFLGATWQLSSSEQASRKSQRETMSKVDVTIFYIWEVISCHFCCILFIRVKWLDPPTLKGRGSITWDRDYWEPF